MLLYVQAAENDNGEQRNHTAIVSLKNVFYECITTASVFLFLAGIFSKFVLMHFRGDRSWLPYRVVKQRSVSSITTKAFD